MDNNQRKFYQDVNHSKVSQQMEERETSSANHNHKSLLSIRKSKCNNDNDFYDDI